MATGKSKENVRLVFKVGAFLAFIMLGYLGIRGYKNSVEKLKLNEASSELFELVYNIQERYRGALDYGELDYKTVATMGLIPKTMFKEGQRDALNPYMGGVDMFYSSSSPTNNNDCFEIAFQGVSQMGCEGLIRLNWDGNGGDMLIAVAGYANQTPSGVLDEIYPGMKQSDVKSRNIFMKSDAPYIASDKLAAICNCPNNTCSVVWKFH
jgi:hypothetical protein